ncbi:hypothetical protein C7271_20635 [filamentous cyanobacterium CCP5]|nr:hypothetical protein C7271_20635 [filamentous cyanobacterium CCP5]
MFENSLIVVLIGLDRRRIRCYTETESETESWRQITRAVGNGPGLQRFGVFCSSALGVETAIANAANS